MYLKFLFLSEKIRCCPRNIIYFGWFQAGRFFICVTKFDNCSSKKGKENTRDHFVRFFEWRVEPVLQLNFEEQMCWVIAGSGWGWERSRFNSWMTVRTSIGLCYCPKYSVFYCWVMDQVLWSRNDRLAQTISLYNALDSWSFVRHF